MSIKVQTQVWTYYPGSGTELLLALAVADFADDEGAGIWPSVETLAKKVRCSDRQVSRIISGMVNKGFLLLVSEANTKRKTREYAINLSYLMNQKETESNSMKKGETPTPDKMSGGQIGQLPLTNDAHTPDTHVTRSIINHKEPPTVGKRKRIPTREEVTEHWKQKELNGDPGEFYDYWDSLGWKRGKTPIQKWKACAATWSRNQKRFGDRQKKKTAIPMNDDRAMMRLCQEHGIQTRGKTKWELKDKLEAKING